MANHVDLLRILYWFCKKNTGLYYKGVCRTTTTYNVEHCVKNDEIRTFFNSYFSASVQKRRFCQNTGKYGCNSPHIRENTDYRKQILTYFTQWSSLQH